MKKKQWMTTIALMLLTAATTYCIALYSIERDYNIKLLADSELGQKYEKFDEVMTYIEKFYVNDYNEKDIMDGALYGMVAMLGDKWSHYLTAEQFASVISSTNNEYVGIGINATYDVDKKCLVVLDVYKDSPAEYAKIQPGDEIVAVDGQEVSQIGYDAAMQAMAGEVDTPVSIAIVRPGNEDRIQFHITRRKIDIRAVKSKILDGDIGYINISNFDKNVDKDFNAALENLKKANVKAIIFDVRNNPGGLMSALVETLDPLLPEGVIIREEDKNGKKNVYRSDKEELNIPMAVLVNENSVSAAEFFAAALQENDKAVIVGMPTTGKGVAQSQIPLKDGAGLVLSTNKYFTGKGVSLEETQGIKPDVEVALTDEQLQRFYLLKESEDPQLQAAIAEINKVLYPETTETDEAVAEETVEKTEDKAE